MEHQAMAERDDPESLLRDWMRRIGIPWEHVDLFVVAECYCWCGRLVVSTAQVAEEEHDRVVLRGADVAESDALGVAS